MNTLTFPIVLIHGLFGHQNDPEIINAFGDNKIYSPDMLGYGEFKHLSTEGITLRQQADHVANYIREKKLGPAHIVGHSVGGAIAALLATHHQDLVFSYTSVEGSFTLKDAFWSQSLSLKSDDEVEAIIAGYKANPQAWFESAGVPHSSWSTGLARSWLDNQPASTIKAQSAAVVVATEPTTYLENLQQVFNTIPTGLIAGALTSSGWDVPNWANQKCLLRINIARVSHLMMAENPKTYADAVITCAKYAEAHGL